VDLLKERDEYLRSIKRGEPWYLRDQRQADWNLTKVERRMDAADAQPATSEMLCGFVIGCICSAAVLAVWNWKF